jgi:hypothetical protein
MDLTEAPGPADVPFAVVTDVAASWPDYRRSRSTWAPAGVAGLIVHAAGPTAEGFRTIEVWTSRAAWRRGRSGVEPAMDGLLSPPVVRELDIDDLVWPMDRRS